MDIKKTQTNNTRQQISANIEIEKNILELSRKIYSDCREKYIGTVEKNILELSRKKYS